MINAMLRLSTQFTDVVLPIEFSDLVRDLTAATSSREPIMFVFLTCGDTTATDERPDQRWLVLGVLRSSIVALSGAPSHYAGASVAISDQAARHLLRISSDVQLNEESRLAARTLVGRVLDAEARAYLAQSGGGADGKPTL